jgi:hypothetical protein
MNELVVKTRSQTVASVSGSVVIPAAIAAAGDKAARRFLEFFAATIRNRNTREAYYRAACSFFAWLEQHDIGELADIEPMHVSLYIETLQATAAKPTVKQHLAASTVPAADRLGGPPANRHEPAPGTLGNAGCGRNYTRCGSGHSRRTARCGRQGLPSGRFRWRP